MNRLIIYRLKGMIFLQQACIVLKNLNNNLNYEQLSSTFVFRAMSAYKLALSNTILLAS